MSDASFVRTRRPGGSSRAPRLGRRAYRFTGMLGCFILAWLILLATFPATIAPYDPSEPITEPFARPSSEHLLGANDIGQDLFSELVWGTRASLLTGLVVAFLAVTIGTLVGLYTGYYHNWLSLILQRLIDLTLALPFLPLVILLGAYLGSSQRNVIIILTLVSWAAPARLVRSRVVVLNDAPFVEAAQALGSSQWRILIRHIWPGARAIALVQFVLVTGSSILAEASLSFLGLGDPATISWGSMLFFAQASGVFLSDAWLWWVLPAGIMITLAVLSLVLISYSLEERLEPGLR